MIETYSIMFSLVVIFSVLNYKYLKLPNSIGLFLIGIILAVIIIITEEIFPTIHYFVSQTIEGIDFKSLLLDGLLGFLLFAGAIHVNLKELDCSKWSVLLFATIGVFITAGVVGTVLYFIAPLIGVELPLVYALLFGALISPTDPIAVLSILDKSSLSKSLLVKFKGESLFNDGIGVILFSGMLLVVNSLSDGSSEMVISDIGELFLKEIGGGLTFGAILGFGGYKSMLLVKENPRLATMVSLAVVVGGYAITHLLYISGPLAMVIAGLIIGNKIHIDVTCDKIQKTVADFWLMLDEILNAIVFFMMGLILHLLEFDWHTGLLAGIVIIVVLIARYIGILIPFSFLGHQAENRNKASFILTWGGLRGGISIALALGVSKMHHGSLLLLITFFVVFFSIVVQGLTIERIYKKMFGQ